MRAVIQARYNVEALVRNLSQEDSGADAMHLSSGFSRRAFCSERVKNLGTAQFPIVNLSLFLGFKRERRASR